MSANGKTIWTEFGIIILVLGCGVAIPVYGFAGGTGEPNHPYQIATVADLVAVGADTSLLDKHFILLNDLDLDPNLPGGRVFRDALIARDTDPSVNGSGGQPFQGVFDGRGHTIHHLCIAAPYGYDAGLFGNFGGLVKDLHLKDVRINGAPCGALVGMGVGGTILRCSVTGKVAGSNYLGGLVGGAFSLVLLCCESQADVVGDADGIAGGLVGSTFGTSSQVIECRAGGTVLGGLWAGGLIGSSDSTVILRSAALCQVTTDGVAGGLIGHGPHDGSVVDCYARGSVMGIAAGGLIGNLEGSGFNDSRILNSYAVCDMLAPPGNAASPVGSGLFGGKQWPWQPSIVLGCFWDKELVKVPLVSDLSPASYGTGLTTQQMQQQDMFQQAGWDFGSTWVMPESGYPVLRWELAAGVESKPQE
jgi:hypothetical protein